jgi:hypothetical protein
LFQIGQSENWMKDIKWYEDKHGTSM